MNKLINLVNDEKVVDYGDSKLVNNCPFHISIERDFFGVCDLWIFYYPCV